MARYLGPKLKLTVVRAPTYSLSLAFARSIPSVKLNKHLASTVRVNRVCLTMAYSYVKSKKSAVSMVYWSVSSVIIIKKRHV